MTESRRASARHASHEVHDCSGDSVEGPRLTMIDAVENDQAGGKAPRERPWHFRTQVGLVAPNQHGGTPPKSPRSKVSNRVPWTIPSEKG